MPEEKEEVFCRCHWKLSSTHVDRDSHQLYVYYMYIHIRHDQIRPGQKITEQIKSAVRAKTP